MDCRVGLDGPSALKTSTGCSGAISKGPNRGCCQGGLGMERMCRLKSGCLSPTTTASEAKEGGIDGAGQQDIWGAGQAGSRS
jgi:hypothetical protein